MMNVKDNYKNSKFNTKCDFFESDDTTEHLFECPIFGILTQEEMKSIN